MSSRDGVNIEAIKALQIIEALSKVVLIMLPNESLQKFTTNVCGNEILVKLSDRNAIKWAKNLPR